MLLRIIFLFYLFVSFVYSEVNEYNFYKDKSLNTIEKGIEEHSLNSEDVNRWLRQVPSREEALDKVFTKELKSNLRRVEITLSNGDLVSGELSFSGEKIFVDSGFLISRDSVASISFYDWGVIYSRILDSSGVSKYYFGPTRALFVTRDGREYRTKINPFDFSHFLLNGGGVYSIFFFDIWLSNLDTGGAWKFAKSKDKNYYSESVNGEVVKEVTFIP